MTGDPPTPKAAPRWRRLVPGLGWAYALLALVLMGLVAPRVPYADQYRFLANHLQTPFPANVFLADNGHREVLPNAVRVVELVYFDANQQLQIGVGVLLALLTCWLLWGLWRGLDRELRQLAMALSLMAVFWLGHWRKLLHDSEQVTTFFVLGFLVVGLRCLVNQDREAGPGRSVAAALCAILATLSFGSGVACFAAFFAVLACRRAPLRHWTPLLVAAILGAVLLLFGGGGNGASVQVAPLQQGMQLLRWLGSPAVWAFRPLLDTAAAERLPLELLTGLVEPIASAAEQRWGSWDQASWPGTGFGIAGGIYFCAQVLRLLRGRGGDAMRHAALGLACFGLCAGALLVVLRTTYFSEMPREVFASRYVIWAMMFWLGLGLLLLLDLARRPGLACALVLGVAIILAPGQYMYARTGLRMQRVADFMAVQAVVGVIPRGQTLSENVPGEIRRAIPLLRAHKKAMFRWPTAQVLGERLDETRCRILEPGDLQAEVVQNRLGAPGLHLRFRVDAGDEARLLILDAGGVVQGLALRHNLTGDWHGFVRGTPDPRRLRIAVLRSSP